MLDRASAPPVYAPKQHRDGQQAAGRKAVDRSVGADARSGNKSTPPYGTLPVHNPKENPCSATRPTPLLSRFELGTFGVYIANALLLGKAVFGLGLGLILAIVCWHAATRKRGG